jgi:hypothetical protein
LSAADPGIAAAPPDDDIAALARGGRTNVFGFALRLIARLPFLFIAGQLYGAEALGRFAYAVIVVEFAAQLATLGPQARPRPAAARQRPAPGLHRVGRDARRLHRLGGGERPADAAPAGDVPRTASGTARTSCCRW